MKVNFYATLRPIVGQKTMELPIVCQARLQTPNHNDNLIALKAIRLEDVAA